MWSRRLRSELLCFGICKCEEEAAYKDENGRKFEKRVTDQEGLASMPARRMDILSFVVLPDAICPCVGHEPVINGSGRDKERKQELAKRLGSIACE